MSKHLKTAIEANDADLVGRALKGVKDVNRKLAGADLNARDGLGRTPLMMFASSLEGVGSSATPPALRKESSNDRANGEAPIVLNEVEVLQRLLAKGADATLLDHSGNDVIDHYIFEHLRSNGKAASEILKLLRDAGAKGSEPTIELFQALRKKNLRLVCAAIRRGADVNRVTPPPASYTPPRVWRRQTQSLTPWILWRNCWKLALILTNRTGVERH